MLGWNVAGNLPPPPVCYTNTIHLLSLLWDWQFFIKDWAMGVGRGCRREARLWFTAGFTRIPRILGVEAHTSQICQVRKTLGCRPDSNAPEKVYLETSALLQENHRVRVQDQRLSWHEEGFTLVVHQSLLNLATHSRPFQTRPDQIALPFWSKTDQV